MTNVASKQLKANIVGQEASKQIGRKYEISWAANRVIAPSAALCCAPVIGQGRSPLIFDPFIESIEDKIEIFIASPEAF